MTELEKRILAGRIKDLRIHLGETQQQFANRLKVPLEKVTSYEIAIRRPSYNDTHKLYLESLSAGQRDLADYFKDRLQGLFEWDAEGKEAKHP